jgi:hypothetical protein
MSLVKNQRLKYGAVRLNRCAFTSDFILASAKACSLDSTVPSRISTVQLLFTK